MPFDETHTCISECTYPSVILTLGCSHSSQLRSSGGKKIGGDDGEEEEEEEFDLWREYRNQFQEAILPEYDEEEGNLYVAMFTHYISFTFKVGHIAAMHPMFF